MRILLRAVDIVEAEDKFVPAMPHVERVAIIRPVVDEPGPIQHIKFPQFAGARLEALGEVVEIERQTEG